MVNAESMVDKFEIFFFVKIIMSLINLVQDINTAMGYRLLNEEEQKLFIETSVVYAKREDLDKISINDLKSLIKFYNQFVDKIGDKKHLKVYDVNLDENYKPTKIGSPPPKELLKQYADLVYEANVKLSKSKTVKAKSNPNF